MKMKTENHKIRKNRFWKWLIQIEGDPKDIASGFAVGVFVGMTPFLGVHIVLSLVLAMLFQANKIAACIGVQITNILTAPFFYSLTYWIGSEIMGNDSFFNRSIDFSWDTIGQVIYTSPSIFVSLIVGGIILGLPLSILAYLVALYSYRKYHKPIRFHIKKPF